MCRATPVPIASDEEPALFSICQQTREPADIAGDRGARR
jgi:hypothetical protein